MSMPRLSYGPLGLRGRLHNAPSPTLAYLIVETLLMNFSSVGRRQRSEAGYSRVACVDETSMTVREVYAQVPFSRVRLIP